MKMFLTVLLIFPLCAFADDSSLLQQLEEYERRAKEWKIERERLENCEDIAALSNFLANSLNTVNAAATSEAYADLFENLALNKTACLLEAIGHMSDEERKGVLYHFIVNPLYHLNGEIDVAILAYNENEKYRNVVKLYKSMKTDNKAINPD